MSVDINIDDVGAIANFCKREGTIGGSIVTLKSIFPDSNDLSVTSHFYKHCQDHIILISNEFDILLSEIPSVDKPVNSFDDTDVMFLKKEIVALKKKFGVA